MIEPFRQKGFLRFFCAAAVSNTALWFQNLVLALVILTATGSAQALGFATLAQFGPLVLLSVPAGRLASRLSPRTIMIAVACGNTVLAAVLAVIVHSDSVNLPALYLVVTVFGCLSAFERVSAQAIIPHLVPERILGRAVATFTIALSAARAIGPGAAGALSSLFGPVACLVVASGGYLVVAVLLVFVQPSPAAPTGGRPSGTVVTRPRYSRWFLTLLITGTVIPLLALNLNVVLTTLVSGTFSGTASELGAAHALNAVGAIAGGAVAASRSTHGPRGIALSCVALSASLLAMGLAPTLVAVFLISPLLGVALGFYQGMFYAAAQSAVQPAQIPRAMALVTLGQFGALPIGSVIAGAIIDVTSPSTAILIGATAAIVSASAPAFFLLRSPGRYRG